MTRRPLTLRALSRYLRLALRRGDDGEAARYARELAGYLGRTRACDAADCLATYRQLVASRMP